MGLAGCCGVLPALAAGTVYGPLPGASDGPAPGGAAHPPACASPALPLEALAPGLWWLPAPGLDSDAGNRGQVLNLLVALHEGGLWLLGSGPSPVFGARLRCQLQARLGWRVVAVVNPMARAELVLGNQGFAGVPVWAPQAIAQAMATQCPGCVERLRARLGSAAADLGPAPTRLPDHHLPGTAGRLGPFEWQLVERGPGQYSSLWHWRDAAGAQAWTVAYGLLGGAAPPDTHEADLQRLPALLAQLLQPPARAAQQRWLPEQGGPLERPALRAQQAYWQALLAAAQRGADSGEALPRAPMDAQGPLPAWQQQPRHALAWQRAWRQAEDRALLTER